MLKGSDYGFVLFLVLVAVTLWFLADVSDENLEKFMAERAAWR